MNGSGQASTIIIMSSSGQSVETLRRSSQSDEWRVSTSSDPRGTSRALQRSSRGDELDLEMREERLPVTPASSIANNVARAPEDEVALMERICAGERQLFYELICPYQRCVYMAAYSVLQNEADAEEVAQEAFLKALTHLSSFRRESKFSTWLIQIAVNEARMKRRKDRRFLYDSIDEPAEEEAGDYFPRDFADWREIPSEALQRTELRRALQKAIASLRPKYREVFIMRDIQHLSIAETASALEIKEASVKTRLMRARLQIRDALAPGIDGTWRIGDGKWKKVRPW